MITQDGFSKDQAIQPEGIVITFGKEMITQNGGMKTFLVDLNRVLSHEQGVWLHKMTNAPAAVISDAYIIIANRLYGRVKSAGIDTGPALCYTSDGRPRRIICKRILLIGPIERCPFKRTLKGFQGFRYCTKLF